VTRNKPQHNSSINPHTRNTTEFQLNVLLTGIIHSNYVKSKTATERRASYYVL
jgi:hypothetical protein